MFLRVSAAPCLIVFRALRLRRPSGMREGLRRRGVQPIELSDSGILIKSLATNDFWPLVCRGPWLAPSAPETGRSSAAFLANAALTKRPSPKRASTKASRTMCAEKCETDLMFQPERELCPVDPPDGVDRRDRARVRAGTSDRFHISLRT